MTVKLRRLKIHQFRNVVPGTELTFDDGVNVLLGKNGTGKTTLLALVSSVCRSDFSAHADRPFDIEYELDLDVRRGSVRLTNTPVPSGDLPSTSPNERHALTLEARFTGDTNFVIHGSPGTLTISASERPDPGYTSPASHILQTALWRAARLPGTRHLPLHDCIDRLSAENAFRFDESLETFKAMLGTPHDHGPALPEVARLDIQTTRPDAEGLIEAATIFSFLPETWARAIGGSQAILASEDPGLVLDEHVVPELASWGHLLGARSLTWRSTASKSEPFRRSFTTFDVMVTRNDRSTIRHELLSYGQKRLLALLYYMAANDDFLVADELVNGLHHEWIEAVVKRIEPRQAFLTSQNPLLFDFLTIESAEQAQTMFVTCSSRTDASGRAELQWRNMTIVEASTFFEELDVGAEYASEILLRRGLW